MPWSETLCPSGGPGPHSIGLRSASLHSVQPPAPAQHQVMSGAGHPCPPPWNWKSPPQKKFQHRVWPIQFMNCYWHRSYLCLVVKHYKWTMGTINFSESKLLESLVYISLSTGFPADSELTPGEILLTRITWRNYESPFIRGSSALCLFHKCLL